MGQSVSAVLSHLGCGTSSVISSYIREQASRVRYGSNLEFEALLYVRVLQVSELGESVLAHHIVTFFLSGGRENSEADNFGVLLRFNSQGARRPGGWGEARGVTCDYFTSGSSLSLGVIAVASSQSDS